MKLYSVYQNSYECSSLVFHTYIQKKAEKFVTQYNSINNVDQWTKAYVVETELTPEVIEQHADDVLATYKGYWVVTVWLYPTNWVQINSFSYRYDEVTEESVEPDIGHGYREIYLIEYENPEFLDSTSPEFLQRVKKLVEEFDSNRGVW